MHQFLTVPLLGTNGHLLGMFGVLDRLDGTGISQEDIRRARALSNQAAVMLEVASNLHSSEKHRRRAEALIDLAGEIDGALRLPEFGRRFVCRIAELTGSQAGLLAVRQEGQWQIAARHEQSKPALLPVPSNETFTSTISRLASPDPNSLNQDSDRLLGEALADFLQQYPNTVVAATAEEALGADQASALGWTDCILVRLAGAGGKFDGALCLAKTSPALSQEDRGFLETMAGHAGMALENARLFTRDRAGQSPLDGDFRCDQRLHRGARSE